MLSFSAVYAVDIDMNIENENIQNNVSNDTIPRNEVQNNTVNNTTSPVSNVNAPAKTSTTTTSEDFHLSVSDIINIILYSCWYSFNFTGYCDFNKIKINFVCLFMYEKAIFLCIFFSRF